MKIKKIEFYLDKNHQISLNLIKNPKKPFISKVNALGFGKIAVDNLFFKEFSKIQQKTIIYHELWHKRNNVKFEFKILFSKNFWIFFRDNKMSKMQEFEADKYSAIQNGKTNCLSMLKTVQKLMNKGVVDYNYKNHPTIKERISKIRG